MTVESAEMAGLHSRDTIDARGWVKILLELYQCSAQILASLWNSGDVTLWHEQGVTVVPSVDNKSCRSAAL